jgi:hypothetical protein
MRTRAQPARGFFVWATAHGWRAPQRRQTSACSVVVGAGIRDDGSLRDSAPGTGAAPALASPRPRWRPPLAGIRKRAAQGLPEKGAARRDRHGRALMAGAQRKMSYRLIPSRFVLTFPSPLRPRPDPGIRPSIQDHGIRGGAPLAEVVVNSRTISGHDREVGIARFRSSALSRQGVGIGTLTLPPRCHRRACPNDHEHRAWRAVSSGDAVPRRFGKPWAQAHGE